MSDPRRDPLEFAATLSRSFAQTLDIGQTVNEALREIVELLRVEAGAIFLWDDARDNLICRACVGPVDIKGLSVPKGSGIVGRAVEEDKVQIVENVHQDRAFFADADKKTGFTTRSILCAPLIVGANALGAIEVLNKRDGRPFDSGDSSLLKVMAASAALAFSNARLADRLVEQERMQRELELASEIQRGLLPRDDDPASPICGMLRPIREVSGDFYDYFELPDGSIAFALGDVSGKGMNAALLMAKTASLFRCLGKTVRDPGRLLSIINKEICETVSRGMFVTMVCGLYEPASGHVRYANAGHLPPLLRHREVKTKQLPADSPPLGILPLSRYVTEEVALDGGQFVTFSDGLTEFQYGDEELGSEGLDILLESAKAAGLADRLKYVVGELDREGWRAKDDLTLMIIDDGLAASAWERHSRAESEVGLGSDFLLGLTFPADPKRLRMIRPAIRAAASACGFEEEEIEDVLLAASEAIENIIVHAYGGDKSGEIVLAMHRVPDGVLLRIRDFAPPTDPAKMEPRDLSDVRPGGLGTHFIRAVMDDASFVALPDGEGNLLELVKRKRA